MTAVEFHTGVGDKLAYACRLCAKAFLRGARVVVHADAQLAARLDQALWTFEPLSFVPHARVGAAAPPATPIWIAERLADPPHRSVLVNLAPQVAEGFESFERLIEVVAADDADVQSGRERWRHYQSRGYRIEHRRVAAAPADD